MDAVAGPVTFDNYGHLGTTSKISVSRTRRCRHAARLIRKQSDKDFRFGYLDYASP